MDYLGSLNSADKLRQVIADWVLGPIQPLFQELVQPQLLQFQRWAVKHAAYKWLDRSLLLPSQQYTRPLMLWYWRLYQPEQWPDVKNWIFLLFVHFLIFSVLLDLISTGPSLIKRYFMGLIRWLFKGTIERELGKVRQDIEHSLIKYPSKFNDLPTKGLNSEQLYSAVEEYKRMDKVDWKGGRVSGTVYHGGKELSDDLTLTYGTFCFSNPLHPDVFPSVRQMEAEIIRMVLSLFNGSSDDCCGNMTSGGTESILMACLAYRERARALKGVEAPEMIVPITAHAAFDKAAHYFNIKLVHAPIDSKTWQVDLRKVAKLINRNTIMLVGSACNYPHGIFDDIPNLGKLAKRWDIGLHIDCCLGSFIVPFLEQMGIAVPRFDFRVDGVTSISCDTHKFGFAPKGSSVIMYSSKSIRRYQYFFATQWTGGIYASPSMAGSRSGALIAACWAALVRMGRNGYAESARKIVAAAQKIAQGIRKIDGIELCGDPQAMVVAFRSKKLNIYAIGDAMTAKGWNLNSLQNPAAVHICCTLLTVPVVDKFLDDLESSVKQVCASGKSAGKQGNAAIYGMAASIPDKSLVNEVACTYLDIATQLKYH